VSDPAATATSELVERAQALDKPRQVASDEGEWNLAFGGRMQWVTRAQLDDLRPDGSLIEEATNPDGLRRTNPWRRDTR
jgi:hypothetical protein